jgi:hypothetical protein
MPHTILPLLAGSQPYIRRMSWPDASIHVSFEADDPALAVTPLNATIAATGKHCSQQLGRKLQLGVEIVNRSAYPVMVQEFAATLPLGGMQVVDAAWAPAVSWLLSRAGRCRPCRPARPLR